MLAPHVCVQSLSLSFLYLSLLIRSLTRGFAHMCMVSKRIPYAVTFGAHGAKHRHLSHIGLVRLPPTASFSASEVLLWPTSPCPFELLRAQLATAFPQPRALSSHTFQSGAISHVRHTVATCPPHHSTRQCPGSQRKFLHCLACGFLSVTPMSKRSLSSAAQATTSRRQPAEKQGRGRHVRHSP